MSVVLRSVDDHPRQAVLPLVAGGVLLVAGVVWLVFFPGWFRLLGLLFIVLSAVVFGPGLRTLAVARRLRPGELALPGPTLRLGEPVAASFQRTVRRGTGAVRAVTARLQLQEWVQYQVGTDTRTASEVVAEWPVAVTPQPGLTGPAARLDWTMPTFPPSFEASNNEVRWWLLVDVTFADEFTEDSRFRLQVLPILVDRAAAA